MSMSSQEDSSGRREIENALQRVQTSATRRKIFFKIMALCILTFICAIVIRSAIHIVYQNDALDAFVHAEVKIFILIFLNFFSNFFSETTEIYSYY